MEMAPYLLLGLLFVAVLNLFISKDIIVRHVGKKDFWSLLKSALFGVPLPLCSCGVIPTAVYMKKNGASNGATISFLISTPQTGIDSIMATYGMMGPVFAIFRPLAALIMGIVGGLTVHFFDRENLDKNIGSSSKNSMPKFINISDYVAPKKESFMVRLNKTIKYSFVEFIDDISGQFIVGLIIAGLIAYFLPAELIESSGIGNGFMGMIIMILIGIPMYVCATASIPIALTLMMKGFSPGVAFVFLVAGPATNAASIAIIMKTIGKTLTIIYLTTIIVLSILFGFILDWIFSNFNLNISDVMHSHIHGTGLLNSTLNDFIAVLFLLLLVASIYRKYIRKYFMKEKIATETESKVNISGMTCNHCVMNVKKTIEKISGVQSVNVLLSENAAYIKGNFDIELLKKEIDEIGYKVEE